MPNWNDGKCTTLYVLKIYPGNRTLQSFWNEKVAKRWLDFYLKRTPHDIRLEIIS